MTLDFDSLIRSVAQRFVVLFISGLTFSVLAATSPVAGHAVNSAHQFSNCLPSDQCCLFINEEITKWGQNLESKADRSEIEFDVFPLESSVIELAQRLASGIAGSLRNEGVHNGLAESSVNLNVFVSNNVQQSSIQDDPYWSYYLCCDQWNVVFNNDPDFSGHYSKSSSAPERESDNEFKMEQIIDRLKAYYLQIEFVFIEQAKVHQIAKASKSSQLNQYKCFSPITDVVNFRNTGWFGFWETLFDRIEMASRLVFGIKYVSELANQYMGSYPPPVQH